MEIFSLQLCPSSRTTCHGAGKGFSQWKRWVGLETAPVVVAVVACVVV